jgi:hypothetical protein
LDTVKLAYSEGNWIFSEVTFDYDEFFDRKEYSFGDTVCDKKALIEYMNKLRCGVMM